MDLRPFLSSCENALVSDAALAALSAARKARIIFSSENALLAERRRALREIVETLPDETVRCAAFETGLPFEQSLHGLLRAYLKEQRCLEEAFFADEPEVVYRLELRQPVTGEHWEADEPSLSWAACRQSLSEALAWERRPGPWRAEVTKYYPKVFLEGFMRQITAYFDEGGALLDVSSRMQMTVPRYRELAWQLGKLPITEALYAPAPFRKGDILELLPSAFPECPGLPKGPLLLMADPDPAWRTLTVFCFGGEDCAPCLRDADPRCLRRYEGSQRTPAYRLMREVSSALVSDGSLGRLDQRLGAALTFPVEGFFGNR